MSLSAEGSSGDVGKTRSLACVWHRLLDFSCVSQVGVSEPWQRIRWRSLGHVPRGVEVPRRTAAPAPRVPTRLSSRSCTKRLTGRISRTGPELPACPAAHRFRTAPSWRVCARVNVIRSRNSSALGREELAAGRVRGECFATLVRQGRPPRAQAYPPAAERVPYPLPERLRSDAEPTQSATERYLMRASGAAGQAGPACDPAGLARVPVRISASRPAPA